MVMVMVIAGGSSVFMWKRSRLMRLGFGIVFLMFGFIEMGTGTGTGDDKGKCGWLVAKDTPNIIITIRIEDD